jgi:peptide/nickel transport system permease protein
MPIGILSAVRRDSAIDLAGRLLSLIGLALPNFWLGTLIILVLSVVFHTLPNSGDYTDLVQNPILNLKQLIFPAITLGFAFSASVVRTTRSSLLEELGQDYARTARGKGLREQTVIVGHCLANALIPVITIVGVEIGYLLGGAIIVEEVFALPGVGRLLLNGINQRDYAVVQGTVLFVALNFVIINLLADLAYAFVNPRIRHA